MPHLGTRILGIHTTRMTIQGPKLETIDHFKFLGAIISDEGSIREVLSRASQTMAALTRLKTSGKTRTSE